MARKNGYRFSEKAMPEKIQLGRETGSRPSVPLPLPGDRHRTAPLLPRGAVLFFQCLCS